MFDENKIAVKVFNEMAEIYQQKYMNVDLYKEALDCLIDNLNHQSTILDIACGPGNILKFLAGCNKEFDLSGIDLSVEMIKLANLNVPSAKFIISDCRNISFVDIKYNAVICNFLLPYLQEKESYKLFDDINDMLVSSGVLYLGFIMEELNCSEIVKSTRGDKVRMNYYSIDFILNILYSKNFKILYSKAYISNNLNQQKKDFVIIASK